MGSHLTASPMVARRRKAAQARVRPRTPPALLAAAPVAGPPADRRGQRRGLRHAVDRKPARCRCLDRFRKTSCHCHTFPHYWGTAAPVPPLEYWAAAVSVCHDLLQKPVALILVRPRMQAKEAKKLVDDITSR